MSPWNNSWQEAVVSKCYVAAVPTISIRTSSCFWESAFVIFSRIASVHEVIWCWSISILTSMLWIFWNLAFTVLKIKGTLWTSTYMAPLWLLRFFQMLNSYVLAFISPLVSSGVRGECLLVPGAYTFNRWEAGIARSNLYRGQTSGR